MVSKSLVKDDCVSKAKLSMLKSSPRKVNLVLKNIRGCEVTKAIDLLSYTNKASALPVKKLLLSAISNAEQSGFTDLSSLIVKVATAGKAVFLRRFHPRGRGRISPVQKMYSNVYIELFSVSK